jgi:hypothetical protein
MGVFVETAVPPSARELAAFDAATSGTPRDFVRTCAAAGIVPAQMLDLFDAAPWRWMSRFTASAAITDEMRHRPFQPAIQDRLDAARQYLEASWWRRTFSDGAEFVQMNSQPPLRTRSPDR